MPRSKFAVDGIMLYGSSKSTLMGILESLDTGRNFFILKLIRMQVRTGIKAYTEGRYCRLSGWRVQALKKLDWIKNFSHLAVHFTALAFD